jgi:PilZ domain
MTQERRRAKRTAVQTRGMIYTSEGKPLVACVLHDVSPTGAKLAIAKEIALPKSFVLSLSRGGQVRRECTLAWQFSVVVGVRFADLNADER